MSKCPCAAKVCMRRLAGFGNLRLMVKGNYRRLTIEEMQGIASERGGLCLSKNYINSTTHLLWQCAKEHQWNATPALVRRGSWCRQCWLNGRRLTLDEMQRIALSHDGQCLSKTYVNLETPLRWQCAKKHKWFSTGSTVKNGSWCPICAYSHIRSSLEDVQRIAKERGGEFLPKVYRNGKVPVSWRCAKGHVWKATGHSVISGSWCMKCVQEGRRGTIEEMQAIAASRKGRCLSTIYTDSSTNLQWQCGEGHTWLSTPRRIKSSWCRECALARRRLGIGAMQEWAARHGGHCLSDVYKDLETPLAWQCIEGHRWEAKPAAIKVGTWCRECRRAALDQQKKLNNSKKKKRFSMPKVL